MSILSLKFLILACCASILMWVIPHKARNIRVLLCNVAFLVLLGNPNDWVYVCLLVVFTWLMGKVVAHKNTKGILFLSILVPVVALCFYKYAGFFLPNAIFMPLGLSFYTFKVISYFVDVYHKKTSAVSLVKVFDYVTFFPTFMAGPIHRSQPFFQELKQPYTFSYEDQKNGAVQALLGLFEKLVFAEELSHISSLLLESGQGGWYTVLGMILYSFYIYADFDAYSNVAIGVSRMLGFHLSKNFHCPYLAVSIRDFWKRWHISLSSWLQDYIYIPLGGSRKGIARKYLNILIVFLISGLWHGSTIVFAIWGLGHGILNILEDLLRKFVGVKPWMKWFAPFAVILNFILITCLWVFFRAPSIESALQTFQSMSSISLSTIGSIDYISLEITVNEWMWVFCILGIMIVTDLLRNKWDMIEGLCKRNFVIRWAFYFVVMVIAIIFGVYGPGYNPADFIYVTF